MTLILAWRNYFYSAHIVRQLASFLALAIRNRTWWCEAGAASFCSRNVCFLGVDVCVIGRWQQNSSNRLAVSCEPLQLCYCRARKRIIHNSGPAIWYNLMLLLRLHDFCCTYTGMIETVCQKSSYPSSKRGTHAGSVRRLEPKDPVASRSGRDIIVTEINPTVAFCRYNLDGCLVFFKRQKIYFERELIPFFFHPWFCVGEQVPYITVIFCMILCAMHFTAQPVNWLVVQLRPQVDGLICLHFATAEWRDGLAFASIDRFNDHSSGSATCCLLDRCLKIRGTGLVASTGG